MTFKTLSVADYPKFLQLYNSAFPEDERRLYRDASHVAEFVREKGGKFNAFACADDTDDFIGFLSYWTFKGYTYVEHFAVKPEKRGNNIGTEMLRHLFETVSEDVLIEVEFPNTSEAARRIRFYERNGFRAREEIQYTQPPYSAGQKGMPLLLMTHGNVILHDMDSIAEMLKEVYNVNQGI